MSHARGVRFLVLALLFCCGVARSVAAPADDTTIQRRFEGLIAALGQPEAAQRRFVEDNFTQRLKDKRGVAGLVEVLQHLHADFGPGRPLQVQAFDDRVEARFKFAYADELALLTVKFGPPPERLVDGVLTGPAPQDAAPAKPAEGGDPLSSAAIAQAVGASFSGAVIVARNGTPVFAQGFGTADRASGRKNTLDTPINLGSMNKMFTALVVAHLVEAGKIAWTDRVGKYLPDWPEKSVRDDVTIEQLLTHTAGLGDYWGAQHDSQLESLDSVAKYAALVQAKGTELPLQHTFHYSNSGFVMLGLIAEKVTGESYYDLVRRWVYAPAGMQHSDHYLRDDEASGRAVGYEADGNPNTSHLAARGPPAGGGYASANDLLRFAMALQEGRIVSRETLARMTSRHADMGGAGYGYGFGVFDQPHKHYGHNGGAPGISASLDIFPESGIVVVVLSNTDRGAAGLAMALGERAADAPASAPVERLSH